MDLLDWITAVLAAIAVVAALKYPIDGRDSSGKEHKSSDRSRLHD